jgi:GNAT superfamily N-acetyltransferase
MTLTLRKGTFADTEKYITLLRTVRDGMTRKDWFYLDKSEDVRNMMRSGAMELCVAMDGDTMAGGFNILHPGLDEYNYGYDLNFSKEELLKVIHMDTAVVHPDYRGNKLQQRLMAMIEEELKVRFPGGILLTTVHPENLYSLYNVQSLGYTVAKRLPKYGSERFILRKDMP